MNEIAFNSENGLIDGLDQKFKIRLFGFDHESHRIDRKPITEIDGESTNIANSIRQVLDEMQGVPLSGIVLISDGASRETIELRKLAMQMRDLKIPIHTVGVGAESGLRDLELLRIDAPRTAEEDFPVELFATVRRKGFGSKKVNVRLIHENRVLKSKTIELDNDHPIRRVPITIVPRNAGTQKFQIEIVPDPDEAIPQNNLKKFLIKIKPSTRAKILFVEGSPRQEFAFIKRALKTDPNLQIVDRFLTDVNHYGGTHTQISQNFGFYPTSKDDLFEFDAIIFGNISASVFSKDQLEMTADFVRARGGGFLMLGGTRSIGNENLRESFIDTPIAEILPIELELGISDRLSEPYQIRLTSEGKIDPLMTLNAIKSGPSSPRENLKIWSSLPKLIGYSRVKRAKAGTTILAVHPIDRNENAQRILIATHNFNAGRVMVFAPHSSWRWRMFSPKNDDRHARFWRQTAKWLTTQPKDHLTLDIPKISFALKETVEIRAKSLDKNFQPTHNAKIRVVITDPNGKKREISLEPKLGEIGVYTTSFLPKMRGDYKVDLIGTLNGESLGSQEGLFEVAESYEEFSNAEMNIDLLQEISRVSGGTYYGIQNVAEMSDHIPLIQSATSKLIEENLWDLPIFFALICLFYAIEWALRKQSGLI